MWYIQAQLKQFEQPKEVNKRYHTHTVELKDKIAELMVINTQIHVLGNFWVLENYYLISHQIYSQFYSDVFKFFAIIIKFYAMLGREHVSEGKS